MTGLTPRDDPITRCWPPLRLNYVVCSLAAIGTSGEYLIFAPGAVVDQLLERAAGWPRRSATTVEMHE